MTGLPQIKIPVIYHSASNTAELIDKIFYDTSQLNACRQEVQEMVATSGNPQDEYREVSLTGGDANIIWACRLPDQVTH